MGILSFLGFQSNNKNEEENNVLTEELKNSYREKLITDPRKYMGDEFLRIFDVKNEIINRYGFEGIKLYYEFDNSINYYELGDFPEENPWFEFNNSSIEEFITKNFEKIATKSFVFISILKETCKCIYTEKNENEWVLHYCLTKKKSKNDVNPENFTESFVIFTGRAPIYYPKPNESLKRHNWNIPGDLKTFYTIHNGFGERNDSSCYIVPSEDLIVMSDTEIVIEECIEKGRLPKDYSFDNLLQFYFDNGASQCFFKGDHSLTADWFYETLELQYELPFFAFLEFIFALSLEEHYDYNKEE